MVVVTLYLNLLFFTCTVIDIYLTAVVPHRQCIQVYSLKHLALCYPRWQPLATWVHLNLKESQLCKILKYCSAVTLDTFHGLSGHRFWAAQMENISTNISTVTKISTEQHCPRPTWRPHSPASHTAAPEISYFP